MLGGSAKGRSRLSCWRGEFEGEARVEGAKRPRIEGEVRTEGEAREEAGEGSGEGARWAPPQKIFQNYLFIYLFISDHEDPYQQLTYIHA